MKKTLLLSTVLFFITVCNAQLKRDQELPKNGFDSIWHKDLTHSKTADGNVKIHTVPGKYDLYASYKNKQVTGYYAIDVKGNKISPTYSTRSTQCVACIVVENGINHCYDIDCNDVPKQKPKKDAVKTAQ